MKVSIVIPAYNEAAQIAQSIERALAQDYPDFEVIVIDNASQDKTFEIASRYPVRVIREDRKGLLYARECGRTNATGDIIANMDADCLPESDWIARGASFFNDQRVVAASGPYDYHDGGAMLRYSTLWCMKYIYSAFNRLFQAFGAGAITIGGNTFIRASALQRAGGYNTDIEFWGEDTDTAKRMAKIGTVVFHRNLIIKTSARRFKAQGALNLALTYQIQFFKVIFSKSAKKKAAVK
jgi:glycosyltransferase involved in cell wall biosynthesis